MIKDKRTIRAKQEGLRARSAYKLKELNSKFHFLDNADHVLDLGSWPGGWSIVAAEYCSVTAVDLKHQFPVEGVTFIRGDLFDDNVLAQLPSADVVLSDAMVNTAGNSRDQYLSYQLCLRVLAIAVLRLKPNGSFVCKIFQGPDFEEFLQEVKQYFGNVKCAKPASSKSKSKEMYVVAQRFKPNMSSE